MSLSTFTKSVQVTLKRHSPQILTGLGIAGMVATTVMAVKATPKALKICEDLRHEYVNDYQEEPTKIDYVKAAWKCYIPAVVTGAASVACIVGASSVHVRRNAALATAYALSETAIKEYKEKVVETIGEKKERSVRDAIAKDHIEKNPVTKNEVILTEKGNTLCYDMLSGRYFKSDVDKLKRAENELNRLMLDEGSVSLNDFYYEIGLDDIKLGSQLGWDTRNGLISLDFSSQLASDGTPCLVLDFSIPPRYDYYK